MICPECKQETSSLIEHCENCKADLREYQNKHDENMQIKGSRRFLVTSFITMIFSFIGTVVIIIAFFMGTVFLNPAIYTVLPLIFVSSLTGFFATLFSKKTWKKPNKL